jgi:two-component system sensor histidine kinase/response regulator
MSASVSPIGNPSTSPQTGQAGAAAARILLVDDDPINQLVALGLLRRRGWEATAAANGKEALKVLAQQRFDLILMDLQMPELDGFQTASIIRQNEAGSAPEASARETAQAMRETSHSSSQHIPIIALTTASQPGVREKCLASGMDDFLNKPVNPRELYGMIEKYLGGPRK